jgi:hypothetical protein
MKVLPIEIHTNTYTVSLGSIYDTNHSIYTKCLFL